MAEIPNDISEIFDTEGGQYHEIEDFEPYKAQISELLVHLHSVAGDLAHTIKDVVWQTCPADELIGRDFITMMIAIEPEVIFQIAVVADKQHDAWMVTITHGVPDPE